MSLRDDLAGQRSGLFDCSWHKAQRLQSIGSWADDVEGDASAYVRFRSVVMLVTLLLLLFFFVINLAD